MSLFPPIPFPASFEHLAPRGALEAMSAEVLGAFYRLLRFSWTQEPPCTLPADEDILLEVARVPRERWRAVHLGLSLAYTPQDDGRLHNPAARLHFDRLIAGFERRKVASQVASGARWNPDGRDRQGRDGGDHDPPGGRPAWPMSVPELCESDAIRMRIGCESHPKRTAAPSSSSALPSKPLAPAPQRSGEPNSKSASGSGPECATGAQGTPEKAKTTFDKKAAGKAAREAGVDLTDLLTDLDRRAAWNRLEHATWPWAEEGRTNLPPGMAFELANGKHATEKLVAFVLEEIDGIARRQKAQGIAPPNPIALLISGLGAQRKGKAPWTPSFWFEKHWEQMHKNKALLVAMQKRAAESARNESTSKGHQKGQTA